MPFEREYYPSDAIKILNDSEGAQGMSGKTAHAMSTHLRHRTKLNKVENGLNPKHQGVKASVFKERFEDNPLDDDGNFRINSGWLGKGDMAILLCKLLNSLAGRYGLEGLDMGATRVTVQEFFVDATDFFGNKFEGAVAEIRMSPSAPTITYHDNNPRNPKAGQVKAIKINKPNAKGVIRMKDIVGAVAVLDNVGGRLHLQTFYPLFVVEGVSQTSFTLGATVEKIVQIRNGKACVTLKVV